MIRGRGVWAPAAPQWFPAVDKQNDRLLVTVCRPLSSSCRGGRGVSEAGTHARALRDAAARTASVHVRAAPGPSRQCELQIRRAYLLPSQQPLRQSTRTNCRLILADKSVEP